MRGRPVQPPPDPREHQLYDLLRSARDAALPDVPPRLRRNFTNSVISDRILAASTHFLMRGSPPGRGDVPPDPWRQNAYVAQYLRGLMALHGFDQRVRANQGDPDMIATTMAGRVMGVAFWERRNN